MLHREAPRIVANSLFGVHSTLVISRSLSSEGKGDGRSTRQSPGVPMFRSRTISTTCDSRFATMSGEGNWFNRDDIQVEHEEL